MLELKTVLCPVDFTEASERALPVAARVCRRTGARLVLLHDVSGTPPGFMGTGWLYQSDGKKGDDERTALAARRLEELAKGLPAGLAVEPRVTVGPRTATILHVARDLPAGLIVMATRGRSDAEHLSTTEQVLDHAPCPVLVVRACPDGPSRAEERLFAAEDPLRILVPLDFTAHGHRGLDGAYALARETGATLHLLHVEPEKSWEDVRHAFKEGLEGHRRQRVADAERKLGASVPADLSGRVTTEVRLGAAPAEVVAEARSRGIDLVVMGVHEKDPVGKVLFGATSTAVLHECPCPVWFVPERAMAGAARA